MSSALREPFPLRSESLVFEFGVGHLRYASAPSRDSSEIAGAGTR